MNRVCGITGCQNVPNGLYTWGMYPDGNRNLDVPLCESCASNLWEVANGPVKAGLMHFAIRPIPPDAPSDSPELKLNSDGYLEMQV